MQAGMKAMGAALPAITKAMTGMAAEIERATANMPTRPIRGANSSLRGAVGDVAIQTPLDCFASLAMTVDWRPPPR